MAVRQEIGRLRRLLGRWGSRILTLPTPLLVSWLDSDRKIWQVL
jgi:hypothetical protein